MVVVVVEVGVVVVDGDVRGAVLEGMEFSRRCAVGGERKGLKTLWMKALMVGLGW